MVKHQALFTPLSRRQLLRGAVRGGFALGAVALVGCDDNGNDATPTTTATPTPQAIKRGGVLRMGQAGDLNLNTGHPFALLPQNRTLAYACSETLIQYRDSLQPTPLLAERFELSSDRSRATVTLKPDLEFHNGAPVTPEDVLFGLEVIRDPAAFQVAARFELASFVSRITDFRAVDPRTMEFVFDGPQANITDFFAQLHITHKASFANVPRGEVVGTGPFTLREWNAGRNYRLEAFGNWHGAGANGMPYLDAIDVTLFADQNAATLAFEAEDLDAYLAIGGANAARFRQPSLTRVTGKTGVNYMGVNVTNPQLQDKRVRQAIFLAVDRERMVDEVGEQFGALTVQPWRAASPAFDPQLEAAYYNPARARALLAEAQFAQTQPLTLEHVAGVAMQELQAQILQANLDAIGIEVELRPTDGQTYTQRYRGFQFPDFWIASHAFADLTPLTLFQQAFEFQVPNPSHFDSPTYTGIVQTLAGLAPDSAEADTQYGRFNDLWLDEPFLIPTGIPQVRVDLVQDHVRGWPERPEDYILAVTGKVEFGDVWLDT